MDVTCERCGTEYEFDETLLSGRGTSVKCTNCGHVFKVYPSAEADADRTTSVWRLKLEDDSIDMIDSLRELQRRISSGELTPENQIARGEESWKPLGSIPELETFFKAAGVQIPDAKSPSSVPARPGAPASEPPAESSRESSLPPGRRPRQPTLLGVAPVEKMIPVGTAGFGDEAGAAAAAETAAGTTSGTAAETVAETVAETDAETEAFERWSGRDADPSADTDRAAVISSAPVPAEEIEEAEYEERPASGGRPSTPPPAYYDDDDIPGLPGRGGSPLRWLMLIVIAGGLVLMFAQWPRVAQLLGIGGDPALIAASVSEGDASLFEGHPTAYASAIEAYGRAIEAGGDRDPEILSKLSRAYALAAQAQIDDRAGGDSIDTLTTAALMTAQSARELEPRDLEAMLSEADALRLTGDAADARRLVEDVRSMSFSRTAEFFRIDARLSAAESDGGLENGLRSAKQAVELAPEGVPYLLLLARAQLAAGDDSEARKPLERILGDHPDHPVATKLLAELRAVEAAEAVMDAGVPADAAGAAEAAAETAAEPAAETAAEAAAVAETAAAAESGKVTEAAKDSGVGADTPADRKRSAPAKKAGKDEYVRLSEAAGSDAFVDGRPPVRDYDWYIRQGRAELAGENYARARAYFDSALEARPGSAEAMDGLGKVLTGMKDYGSAARYFRVAAQRGHPDGYFNLGRTYERLGRNEEAVSAYYTYVKRRPTGTHAAVAVAAIRRLEPRAKLPPELEPAPEPGPEPITKAKPSPADKPAQESGPATP